MIYEYVYNYFFSKTYTTLTNAFGNSSSSYDNGIKLIQVCLYKIFI